MPHSPQEKFASLFNLTSIECSGRVAVESAPSSPKKRSMTPVAGSAAGIARVTLLGISSRKT
jgi:hypothetical protein